jgi:hypothetical protein
MLRNLICGSTTLKREVFVLRVTVGNRSRRIAHKFIFHCDDVLIKSEKTNTL